MSSSAGVPACPSPARTSEPRGSVASRCDGEDVRTVLRPPFWSLRSSCS